MMKFFLLPLILFGLVASAASGYALTSNGTDEVTGGGRARSVTIGVGESFELPDGSTLEFIEIVEDSRCPSDAVCIWQGQAVLQFELDGKRSRSTYTGPDDEVVVVDGWAIQVLDVQPYPLASRRYDPADVEVTVRVYSAE